MPQNKNDDDFSFDDMFDDEHARSGPDAPIGRAPESNDSKITGDGAEDGAGFDFDEHDQGPIIANDQDDADRDEPAKKRGFLDFEPDMDTILITAQSPMIIEGLRCYLRKDFSSANATSFREALRGVELYMKILERNPDNYQKLKKIIDSDIDCEEVEKTAFNLFKRIHGHLPETYTEKLEAFEMLKNLITKALDRSLISESLVRIKKYFLLSGGVDIDKLNECIMNNDIEFKSFVNQLHQQINTAMSMLKWGASEFAKGVSGKNISIFIIKATDLLTQYYQRAGNRQLADNYARINENYKKYFVIRD